MLQPDLATFKYLHASRAPLSPMRKWLGWISVAIAIGATIFSFGGLVVWLLPIIIFFTAPKRLYLGPRYLICGQAILYYGNVSEIILDESGGHLTLVPLAGSPLLIDREKFPTGARKAPKIKANKAAKFAKVSEKIIERVRQASPNVELQGVKR